MRTLSFFIVLGQQGTSIGNRLWLDNYPIEAKIKQSGAHETKPTLLPCSLNESTGISCGIRGGDKGKQLPFPQRWKKKREREIYEKKEIVGKEDSKTITQFTTYKAIFLIIFFCQKKK